MNTATANMPCVELEIVRGQARRKQRPVNVPAFLIGSSRDCDLVLGDAHFSEVHAYLIVHAGGVSVRHLGFGPELFVNDRQVFRIALRNGDRLRTGPYEFIIHIADTTAIDGGSASFLKLRAGAWTLNPRDCNIDGLKAAEELLIDIRLALRSDAQAIRRPA